MDITPEMRKGVEAGQMLFSSTQRGVDFTVTKSILDGSHEPTEESRATARAFERAIRQSEELRGAFGGRPPRDIEARLPRELRAWQISAAILSELSGKRLVSYTPQSDTDPKGVTVPQIASFGDNPITSTKVMRTTNTIPKKPEKSITIMADFGTSSGTGRHIPYFLRQTL